jgi:hypothetical protein
MHSITLWGCGTLWGSLAFSGAASIAEKVNEGNTRGTHEKYNSSAGHLVHRTNGLVKAIFEVVELRGLEPLTFSLRRVLLPEAQLFASVHVGA